jgi:mono/diheme cytochrome c family protein
MPFNSRKTTVIIWLLIAIFLKSLLSCNTREDAGKSISTDELSGKYRQGKEIFQIKCAACHVAPEKHATDQLVFDNLFDRLPRPSEDYFIRFIKNGKTLKVSGDSYALKLAEVWKSDYKHDFQNTLSNYDLENLIVYIKVAAK